MNNIYFLNKNLIKSWYISKLSIEGLYLNDKIQKTTNKLDNQLLKFSLFFKIINVISSEYEDGKFYIVKYNDTLDKIALKMNLHYSEIEQFDFPGRAIFINTKSRFIDFFGLSRIELETFFSFKGKVFVDENNFFVEKTNIKHNVLHNETWESIAKYYDIDKDDLIEGNPDLKYLFSKDLFIDGRLIYRGALHLLNIKQVNIPYLNVLIKNEIINNMTINYEYLSLVFGVPMTKISMTTTDNEIHLKIPIEKIVLSKYFSSKYEFSTLDKKYVPYIESTRLFDIDIPDEFLELIDFYRSSKLFENFFYFKKFNTTILDYEILLLDYFSKQKNKRKIENLDKKPFRFFKTLIKEIHKENHHPLIDFIYLHLKHENIIHECSNFLFSTIPSGFIPEIFNYKKSNLILPLEDSIDDFKFNDIDVEVVRILSFNNQQIIHQPKSPKFIEPFLLKLIYFNVENSFVFFCKFSKKIIKSITSVNVENLSVHFNEQFLAFNYKQKWPLNLQLHILLFNDEVVKETFIFNSDYISIGFFEKRDIKRDIIKFSELEQSPQQSSIPKYLTTKMFFYSFNVKCFNSIKVFCNLQTNKTLISQAIDSTKLLKVNLMTTCNFEPELSQIKLSWLLHKICGKFIKPFTFEQDELLCKNYVTCEEYVENFSWPLNLHDNFKHECQELMRNFLKNPIVGLDVLCEGAIENICFINIDRTNLFLFPIITNENSPINLELKLTQYGIFKSWKIPDYWKEENNKDLLEKFNQLYKNMY